MAEPSFLLNKVQLGIHQCQLGPFTATLIKLSKCTIYSNSICLPAALHFHNELSTKGRLQLALYLVAGAHTPHTSSPPQLKKWPVIIVREDISDFRWGLLPYNSASLMDHVCTIKQEMVFTSLLVS